MAYVPKKHDHINAQPQQAAGEKGTGLLVGLGIKSSLSVKNRRRQFLATAKSLAHDLNSPF